MALQPYARTSGESGVVAFEPAARSIIVRFVNGATYLYNYDAPGPAAVERMKRLARDGRGLSTYIAQHVRDAYARRLA